MRLKYRFLWKISLTSVILGIFYLLGLCCFANVNEELKRKVEEFFSQATQAEQQEKNIDAENFYKQCLWLAKENNIVQLESPVLHRLAILKAKEQKWTESEQYFREALNLDKENTVLLCDFAKLYADQKNYADAETILKNALLIAPDHRRTLYNLGLIIALQKDRQSEGLRYLKLAIGETAAYRELARIYRQQDNNAQAEFAEQRASILERTQTPHVTDTQTSPTVPMNDQTKQELVQHVREELLRLETNEIAAASQNTTIKDITPQSIPLTAESLKTEPPEIETLTEEEEKEEEEEEETEQELTKQLQEELLSEEPLLAEPLLLPPKSSSTELPETETLQKEKNYDPFLLAIESQKIGELKKDQQLMESAIESSPVEINLNTETESLETVKPFQNFLESSRQQSVKILKPKSQTEEPAKSFQQDRQTNDFRTLPTTDFRISNSTEDDTNIPQQPEVHPLTIIPLEDASAIKNIPEYTAISVRKIPLTESEKTAAPSGRSEEKKYITNIEITAKTEKNDEKNSVSRFQYPVSSDSAPTISISLSKNNTTQNNVSDKTNSDFSARLYLEQPVNLITFNSQRSQFYQPQAPIPVFNPEENSLQENLERLERQQEPSSGNTSTPHRRQDSENIITQNDHSVTKDRGVAPQRSTKSILRPGAGRIGIQEDLDSYVYVNPNALKNNDTPKDEVTSHTSKSAKKTDVTKSAPETSSTKKTATDSFSLLRSTPDKFANQLADSSPLPPITPALSTETETKSTDEIPETKTIETVPPPVAKTSQPETLLPENLTIQNKDDMENIAQTETEINKKNTLQSSLTETPAVLKFEIASTTKSENSDKSEIVNDSDQSNKIITQKQIATPTQPTTVLPETVKSDSLQKTDDSSFQPPTVLKFRPVQNAIVTKPNTDSAPLESVLVQKTEPLLSTHSEQVVIIKNDSDAISIPESESVATDSDETISESAVSTQQTESKTEIADNTSPQTNPDPIEAFLPILTAPQPETFFVQKSAVPPALESPQSESNLKFKISNETETKTMEKPSDEPITEQNTNQQQKITTSSDTLKFITPNRPQQNPLKNKENKKQKLKDDIVSKSISEIISKQEKNHSKPEPVIALTPLSVENSTPKTILERPPTQKRTQTPRTQSETNDVSILKKNEKTQPKLKTEIEIPERLALNSISKEMLSDKSDLYEELTSETKILEGNKESIGFATTRKHPSVVVQHEENGAVDDFLKLKESFNKHPIFSIDSSFEKNTWGKKVSKNQEPEEGTGFARSSKYSKKTQQDSFKNNTK
jgi:hypothetical protein